MKSNSNLVTQASILLLQIIVILLKLTQVEPFYTMSWVWILSFTWVPFAIGVMAVAALKLIKKKDS